MGLFDGHKIEDVAKTLDVTKAELNSFIEKSTQSLDSLERMIQREHGSSMTYEALVRDFYKIGDPYINNIFVRKAIDKVAGMIASVDVKIVDQKDVELPENNPVVQLMNYINDEDSQYDFFFEMIRSLQRFGKVHILKSDETMRDNKTPVSLEILQSQNVKAKTTNGILSGWEYTVGKKKVVFDKDQVLFIRFKHPDKPYDGLAPGGSAIKEIMQDFYAHVYNIKNFQNGAMGKGAWVDPNGSALTPQQKAEAQFAVDNEFNRGVDGAGSSQVLSRRLEWVRTSESNKDLEFINLLNKMRDDILVAYDIPKVLFTSADATFTNLKEAKKLMWSQTLLPIVKKIEDAFNTNFFAAANLPYRLKFDTDSIPELQDDISTKLDSAQRLYAMNVPVSVINEVLSLGLPEDGWEGWDSPAPSFAFSSDVPEQKDTEQIIKEYKKQEAIENEKRINYDKFLLEQEYTKSLNVMLNQERDLSNAVKAFYAEVYKEKIEPWVDEQIKSINKDTVEKSVVDDFKKFIKELDLAFPFFAAVKSKIERTFNMGVYRTYSGIGADFNLDDKRAIEHLTNRGLKLKDSPDVVKQAIITALADDAFTIDQLSKTISKVWKEASLERAKVISITETTAAYNGGRVKGMKELGISKKKWVHSHDGKVRDSHRISDTINVDEDFTLADGYKASYPGDGDAAHSINCRCICISVLD
jgi:HK97 family phage portal protein